MREAVQGDVPDTAGGKAFLADGALSETEIAALDRAQSVFGMEKFYNAWELDALTPNEVHAVLYMLTFYDPWTTVHDVTADPDDPDAEGAEITRTLDDFGVHPGACLFCKQTIERQPSAAPPQAQVHRRLILQHLTHHAKVQADALSPCDLRDFTEEELVALGWVREARYVAHAYIPFASYQMHAENFTASVRLTDELLQFEKDFPRARYTSWRGRTAKVLVQSGEVLSPFTHAMRAAGGPPSERGLEPCLEAVKRIVDWDTKRYDHFRDFGLELHPWYKAIFPTLSRSYSSLTVWDEGERAFPWFYPTWASFLIDESGGSDKGRRLMNQFRALNLPAIRETRGVYYDKTAADASSALAGHRGVLLSPWDLHLHRNIGFFEFDYRMDIDAMIRDYTLPERCELKRLRPGALESALRPHGSKWTYDFWKRDPGLPADQYLEDGRSFWNRDFSVLPRPDSTILEYSCD